MVYSDAKVTPKKSKARSTLDLVLICEKWKKSPTLTDCSTFSSVSVSQPGTTFGIFVARRVLSLGIILREQQITASLYLLARLASNKSILPGIYFTTIVFIF